MTPSLARRVSVGVGFNRQEAGGNSERSEARTGQVAVQKRGKTLMGLRDISATMDESRNGNLLGV